MLSYMLPAVEEKSNNTTNVQPTHQRSINLSLSLNTNNNHPRNFRELCDDESDENTKLLNCERDSSYLDTNENDNLTNHNCTTDSTSISNRKFKVDEKTGSTKSIQKRVSFGSSKGSMVETLVFETPTPLPEYAEKEFTFSPDTHSNLNSGKLYNDTIANSINLNDSGIELQEEVERSKVRVTFFQSNKPQQVNSLENHIVIFSENNNTLTYESILSDKYIVDDDMAATTAIPPSYDRQISAESGWDNPFRPGGDLSKEADEIVNLIKGGKPITPTGEQGNSIANGEIQNPIENGTTVVDGVTKVDAHQLQSTQNGTKSPHKNSTTTTTVNDNNKAAKNGDTPNKTQTQISNQTLPAQQSASHVMIEDKKKKKSCCVVQ